MGRRDEDDLTKRDLILVWTSLALGLVGVGCIAGAVLGALSKLGE